jgi:hypothetical protein
MNSLGFIYSTIRLAADPSCSANLQQAVVAIDAVLTSGNGWVKKTLKGLFGVADLSHDEDFASLITVSPLIDLLCFDLLWFLTCPLAPAWCLASEELGRRGW